MQPHEEPVVGPNAANGLSKNSPPATSEDNPLLRADFKPAQRIHLQNEGVNGASNATPGNTNGVNGTSNGNGTKPSPLNGNGPHNLELESLKVFGREEIEALSGLQRFDDRTLHLLAGYFERGLTVDEQAELAGRLVFPRNSQAAELYKQKIVGGLKAPARSELEYCALFPESKRGSELYRIYREEKRPMKLEEKAELYAIRVFPASPKDAAKFSAELLKTLQPIHDGKRAQAEALADLASFVRDELRDPRRKISSLSELSELFGLSKSAIRPLLHDAQRGLSPEEQALRTEKFSLRREEAKQSLPILTINAIRNLVSIENEMHRNGAITSISERKDIAMLFGESAPTIVKHLRYLPAEDLRHREAVFGNGERDQRIKAVVDSAKAEVKQLQEGKSLRVRSDQDLANALGVLPIAIHHYLKEGLSEPEREHREYALREQQELGSYKQTGLSFVRQELEAFRRGEINRVTTDAGLAKLFNVSEGIICDRLKDKAVGLNDDERKLRKLILTLQEPRDVNSEVLRKVAIAFIAERIERFKSKFHTNGQQSDATQNQDKSNVKNGEARPRQSIEFRGAYFDSYEEAAAATLMKKYIPDFQLVKGKTVQIEMGGRFIDFFVKGVFVEYHPIKLYYGHTPTGKGDLKSFEEYQQFNKVKMALPPPQRKLYIEETRGDVATRYRKEREELIEKSPEYRGTKLILAASAKELYYMVVKAFGENVPCEEKFVREFKRAVARVRAEHMVRRREEQS